MGQKGLHHLFCISQGRSGSREPGSFSFRHWRLLSYSLPLRWGSARPRPPYRGPWHPQAACGGLERAVLLPMALAAGHRRALRAAAAPACRWLPGSRLWAHPCGGERPERPPSRLSRRRQRLSLHEGWQCLGFPPPWRSPLWQRGVLVSPLEGHQAHTRDASPAGRGPPAIPFYRNYRTSPRLHHRPRQATAYWLRSSP